MNPIPSIQQLNDAVFQDLKNNFGLNDDQLRKVISAFSAVHAAQLKFLYLYLGDVQNNIFPDTADLAENGGELERLGQIYLGRNPNPATAGVFEIQFTGVNGSVVRSDLTFKSNDDSKSPAKLYIIDEEYILDGTPVEIRSLGGGPDFDLDAGDQLTITEPVIGVDQTVTITSVVSQPISAESIEDYRQAILDAIQLEPQGGAKTDYMIWAKDAQGVRRVYPYVKESNAGVVEIYVEATIADSSDNLGTPTQAILDEVEDVCEFDPDETRPQYERGRRPIQAILEVQEISLTPVDIDITGLSETTLDIMASVKSNSEAYIRDIRPYIGGADLPRNKNNVLYAARLQSVVTDVLDSANFFTDFVMKVNGVPLTSFQFSRGNIPYLRYVTYN